MVWAGRTERAIPSCAATASLRHCAFDSAASTATTPMVVFRRVPSPPGRPGLPGQAGTPNSSATS